jgi:dephospho-CoA kinase
MPALILDADKSGHAALRDLDVRKRLRMEFGPSIFDDRGEVARPKLAALVFGSGEQASANRKRLEAIVHPWIRRDLESQIATARASGQVEIILLDAPLLLETGWRSMCSAVAYIDAPIELRRQRVGGRGWTAADLEKREASQMPVEEKRAKADVVIDNSGAAETAAGQLIQFVRTSI